MSSDEDEPLPMIVDFHGRGVDPFTGRILDDPLAGPGSIFYVPKKKPEEEGYYQLANGMKFEDIMTKVRDAGFKGGTIFLNITPKPEDEDRPILPRQLPEEDTSDRLYEVSKGDFYRTTCGYCWAVIQNKQRQRGFTLGELMDSASQGCEACNVLQKSVHHFASLIFKFYNIDKVRIRQKTRFLSSLLSQTEEVVVYFDEYGGEKVSLDIEISDGMAFSTTIEVTENPLDSMGMTRSRIMDTSSYAAVKLIKDWLHTCDKEHEKCVIPPVSALPLRVLDVSNSRVRLIESHGQVAPYLTLSHCWGKKGITKLTVSNIEAMKERVDWSSLSRTFQDAITLSWKLGFRYIWIDALCILQDSREDWEYHASRMAQIFSNSQLTISASRAEDGDQGCFSIRTDDPLRLLYSKLGAIRHPLLWQPFEISGIDRDGCEKALRVLLRRPHGLYERKKPKEPLLKRSWVFQEQILSPRMIHFASGELYFECRSYITCECSGWQSRSETSQRETRWRKAHDVLLGHDEGKSHNEKKQRRRYFEAYRYLVETYTELDITQELDRLPALSGVTFGRPDQYLAGMWKSMLRECLHWNSAPQDLNGIMARRPPTYRGPSWSWASIEGPIRHIETNFGWAHFGPRHIAEIISAGCTPEGIDPRGCVSDGYLKIRGPLVVAEVVGFGFCDRETKLSSVADDTHISEFNARFLEPSLDQREKPDPNCTYMTIRKGSMVNRCYLDLPLAVCREQPAEVSLGQQVTCLALSTTTALVLTDVKGRPNVYTRVGYLQPERDEWDFKSMDEIVII